MIYIRSIILLAFLLTLVSCEENATDPKETDKPLKPIDSTGFAIINVTQDTLYYGEEAWIQVNDLGVSRNSLRLFVHTVEVTKMRIEGDRLIFEVPNNAATGRLRLYKHDTLLAKNDFLLNVLPHHIEFQTAALSYFPTEGYPGERVRIRVSDLPLRRREFDVLLNETKLQIVKWDTTHIFVVIPEGKSSGMLTLRYFDKLTQVGGFEVLTHDGVFPTQANSISAQVIVLGKTVAVMTNPDSNMSSERIAFSHSVQFMQDVEIQRTDSIRLSYSKDDGRNSQFVEIALKPHSQKNTCSGRIVIKNHSDRGTQNEAIQTTTVIVKDIPWKRAGDWYYLYAHEEDVTEKVVSVSNVQEYPQSRYVQTTQDYHGGDSSSYMMITLTP